MTVRRHRRYSTEFKSSQLISRRTWTAKASVRKLLLHGMGSAPAFVELAIWIRKYEACELAARRSYLQEQVSEYEARIGALERKIGQLSMELDVMKKRALIRPSDQSARPSIICVPGACPSDEDVAS